MAVGRLITAIGQFGYSIEYETERLVFRGMEKIAGGVILVTFYAVYIGKMLIQKTQGIKTDQMAKGKERNQVFYVEFILKIATYSVVFVEIVSMILVESHLPPCFILAGSILGILGNGIFITAVVTMRENWRAGLAEKDETKMVTSGIYKVSRNPAFLGFDLVYIGILLLFFNVVLFLFSLFAIVMLHIQILQEETYLEKVFGKEYDTYKRRVGRYFGRRNVS